MAKFRRRRPIIDAVQITRESMKLLPEIYQAAGDRWFFRDADSGDWRVHPGDWILTIGDKKRVLDDESFRKHYEAIEE